jgi:outer membrane protein TolC
LELIAARNMLLPQLDLVAHYGFRGFGDDLFGRSNSAFADLMGVELQEWQVGMEFSVPIGNRIGHIAERNAELRLARERALLREQEQYIAHDLAESFTDLDRAFVRTQSTYNSRVAAMEERDAKQLRYLVTEGPFFLLDAQQRLTRSEIAFYRAVIDYNKALLDIQYNRGTMLNQMKVYLAEGPWSDLAHYSAARQSRRFRDGGAIGHVRQDTAPVSAGVYDQEPGVYDQQPVPDAIPHEETP